MPHLVELLQNGGINMLRATATHIAIQRIGHESIAMHLFHFS